MGLRIREEGKTQTRIFLHTSGLLRLREPSVAQRSRFVLVYPRFDLSAIEVLAFPAQVPGKNPNP